MLQVIAGLAMAIAAPAAQVSALPVWLVGNWCREFAGMQLCVRYSLEDGTIRSRGYRIDERGETAFGSGGLLRIEDGRLVMHTADGTVASREVSSGPNDLLMAPVNPSPQGSRRIRYHVEGDELAIEFQLVDETQPPEIHRYKRKP
jgi:hypothetical protein